MDGVNDFTCDCTGSGFEGDQCQNNINDCDPNDDGVSPCLNGGSCTDGINEFSCACAQGWEGDTCQNNIDDCTGNACQFGTCVDGLNAFTCSCDDGFIQECSCDNENSCQYDNGAYTCDDGSDPTFSGPCSVPTTRAAFIRALVDDDPDRVAENLIEKWSDEFSGNSLDTTKWSPEIGTGRDYGEDDNYAGWGDDE